MTSNTVYLILIDIFISLFLFFLLGRNAFRRSENSIGEFFWALREKYPRSYFNQNKLIKKIRKLIGLETHGTIHWMTYIAHYLQMVMLASPIVMLICFLFTWTEKVVVLFLVIGIPLPFILSLVLLDVFTIIQHLRCAKIKKTNPKYAKRETYRWFGK